MFVVCGGALSNDGLRAFVNVSGRSDRVPPGNVLRRTPPLHTAYCVSRTGTPRCASRAVDGDKYEEESKFCPKTGNPAPKEFRVKKGTWIFCPNNVRVKRVLVNSVRKKCTVGKIITLVNS